MASINPFDVLDQRLQVIEDTLQKLVDKPDPEPPFTEKYLTTEEVCESLKVSRVTLWNWQKNGILKSIRIGNLKRYRLSDIESLGKENTSRS